MFLQVDATCPGIGILQVANVNLSSGVTNHIAYATNNTLLLFRMYFVIYVSSPRACMVAPESLVGNNVYCN